MSILLSFLFFLQATTPSPTVKQAPAQKMQQQKEVQALAQAMHPARSMMIIEPGKRAADYKRAWEMLKQEKSTAKVVFELSDGTKIANVIDMTLLPNDTLVVFRYSTNQGIRYEVVAIEDILGIMHQ
jgi:hypothetical protein